jgi:lactate dehydrogenase-like 2-hydroxyacid dehydrogenase
MSSTETSILVTRRWPEAVETALAKRFKVTIRDAPLTIPQWQEAFQQFDAICPCVTDQVSTAVYPASGIRTRLLANYGVGYNHIDLKAASERQIVVTNTPGVLTDATADLGMTLLLMLARRAGEGERQLRSGEWHGWYPTHLMGTMVTGATIGIVGMGRIGMAMARKAHYGFGMRVLYHNRRAVTDPEVEAMQAEFFPELDDMLARSDFVSLHCPGGKDTRHMMDAGRFACMQPHAFLINTARGDVVDEAALAAALDNGQIAGAGLDVFEQEPRVPANLLDRENVVLLPHLGSATTVTRTAMGMRVLANLEAFFGGSEVPDRVG